MTDGPGTSERLDKILRILAKHHSDVNQLFTLSSQDPQETINNMKSILSEHGDILEGYIRWRKVPPQSPPQIMKTIADLLPLLEPWDPKISTLAPRWCYTMFKDYPFTISPDHISTLSQYK
jgi:hypothetical protein